ARVSGGRRAGQHVPWRDRSRGPTPSLPGPGAARWRHDTFAPAAAGGLTDVTSAVPSRFLPGNVVHMRHARVTGPPRGAALIIVNGLFHAQAIDFPKNSGIGVFFANPGFHASPAAKNSPRMRSCTGLSTSIVDKGKTLVRHRLARGRSGAAQVPRSNRALCGAAWP